jgi:3-dehydroquinate synthetase
LRTLPRREWVAGLAEVIKYGMIADEEFFDYLERRMGPILDMSSEPVARIIKRSCEIKAAVVAGDERESDRRRILNYGHTIGHALESLGKYRSLIHGEAVAIGMVQEAELSHTMGYCQKDVVARQRAIVRQAGLSNSLPAVTESALWGAMQRDKKVVQGRVHCVLPKAVGDVVVAPVAHAEFTQWYHSRSRTAAHAR